MNHDENTFVAPKDPEELRARLYGVVMEAQGGDEWYWDDPPADSGVAPAPSSPLTPPPAFEPSKP